MSLPIFQRGNSILKQKPFILLHWQARSNITLLSGGFGLSGVPDTIINAMVNHPAIKNVTAVSNNAGLDGRGLSQLLVTGQITKMISSYIGGNRTFEKLYLTGQIDLELTPQGNLACSCWR